MKEKNTQEALIWITTILNEKDISFQITSGMAARVYGSDRELYDIDLDVPEDRMDEIAEATKQFVIKGPYHHKNEYFDLMLLRIDYFGQLLDLGGAFEVKIFDKKKGEWIRMPTDFTRSVTHTILGIDVPVVTKEELIEYKSMLARPTDLEDVEKMNNSR